MPAEQNLEASVFDEMEEIDLGGGYVARRKKPKKKAPKKEGAEKAEGGEKVAKPKEAAAADEAGEPAKEKEVAASLVEAELVIESGLEKLASGRWKDTNGNSYGTLAEAAEAEAHLHMPSKLDPESAPYKALHSNVKKELIREAQSHSAEEGE